MAQSVPPANTDLAAIAMQIQDRVSLLASEVGIRDRAELERDEAQCVLDQTVQENSIVRRNLLRVLRSRHGFELELGRIQETKQNEVKENEALYEEASRWKEQADEMEATWKHAVYELYAAHAAKRKLYQQFLERRIRHRQRETKRNHDRLDFLERRAQEMLADEKDLHTQSKLLEEQTKLADSREEDEDKIVASLAMQIKTTLTKVSWVSLRPLRNINRRNDTH
jgi:hypothetical protein